MLALLAVLAIAELWAIVFVASHIGVGETILLLVAVSVIGLWLVKRAGLGVLDRMWSAVDQGRVPHREVLDGFLLLLAGILLVPPGFITDAFGLLLLVPPVRIAIRARLVRSLNRRTSFAVRVVGVGRRVRGSQAPPGMHDVASRDVTGQPRPPGSSGELEP